MGRVESLDRMLRLSTLNMIYGIIPACITNMAAGRAPGTAAVNALEDEDAQIGAERKNINRELLAAPAECDE